MREFFVKFVATGLFSGYMRPYAGTWGTIPAWLIGWFLLRGDVVGLSVAAAVSFGLSVWSAGEAEKLFGHDARKIVMDEWTGMFITLLFIPPDIVWYGAAFFAFRLFDVVKIPPARQMENLPGGWGVTMDDVIAGIQANIALHIVIYLAPKFM